jgi:hypothetical protein
LINNVPSSENRKNGIRCKNQIDWANAHGGLDKWFSLQYIIDSDPEFDGEEWLRSLDPLGEDGIPIRNLSTYLITGFNAYLGRMYPE